MMLPAKIQSGLPFKTTIVHTINAIIDYLYTQRLVSDGKTVRLNQTASGITITATAQGGGGSSITKNITENTFTGGDSVVCVIRQATAQAGVYSVYAYPNGIGTQPRIQTKLVFGDYALTTSIPINSVVVANAVSLQVVGGN